MDQTQSNTNVEDRNTGHNVSRKKPNGVIKFDSSGSMWYREPQGNDESAWKRAVWHDDIRDCLIQFTDRNGAYAHGREKGSLDNDVTSFHREHASWGYDVQDRPEILFKFEPLERKDPVYKIGPWIYRGCVVLDADNHPVRNFKEIPLTCSTKIEPWLQETLRRMHSKITANDFRARMPRDPTGQGLRGSDGEWKGEGKDPLLSAATYDFQMTRFRQKHRCISWVKRGGSTAFKDYLWSIMTPEMRNNNTTRGLGDIVDRGELAKMSLANKGKHLSRAGARGIPDAERKKRLAKEKARAMKFDQRQAAEVARSSRKRKRAAPTVKNEKEKVRPVSTTTMLSTELHSLAKSTPSFAENGVTHNSKDNFTNYTWERDDKYKERLGNEWDGQYYGDDEDYTAYDVSINNYAYYPLLDALVPPNKKIRTDSAHQEEALHSFDRSANHIALPVDWSEQYPSFSSVSTNIIAASTPSTAEALTPTGCSFDTNSALESDHITTIEDRQGFLDKTPSTLEQKLLIHHLLQPTKEQYTSFTYHVPPEVDSNMSYLWQYGEMAGGLTQWWRSHGHEGVRPTLIGLVDCTSSQLTWNTPTPPQLSVDITTLLAAVFSENTAQAEPVLDVVDRDAHSAWDDDCFSAYIHLDKTDKALNLPSEEVNE